MIIAPVQGGGIMIDISGESSQGPSFLNTTIAYNNGSIGGGLYIAQSTATTFTNVNIDFNNATFGCGGARLFGSSGDHGPGLIFRDSSFTGNKVISAWDYVVFSGYKQPLNHSLH